MTAECRICRGRVDEFLDLGEQPLSDCFRTPPPEGPGAAPPVFRLRVGSCATCRMVQLMEEVPRDDMFGIDYPYRSAGSQRMRAHLQQTAEELVRYARSCRPDPFIVEIGSNDGTMLHGVAVSGVRHLGVEPSTGVAATAVEAGVNVLHEYFDRDVAARVAADHGPADVIFSANTICHIPYLDSILDGVWSLLADDGVFSFEDPYLGDIVQLTSFDQIYDEHFFLFSASTVQTAARRHGLELADVRRLPVHGGEVRYTLKKAATASPTPEVDKLIAEERQRRLHEPQTLAAFADHVHRNASDLKRLLEDIRGAGASVVGYGATAKSATVTNYCGIGPDLVSYVVDITPEKQGRLTPGMGIPIHPTDRFRAPYPEYALLFAWNHAEEILAKEAHFTEAGGKWITYIPEVRVR